MLKFVVVGLALILGQQETSGFSQAQTNVGLKDSRFEIGAASKSIQMIQSHAVFLEYARVYKSGRYRDLPHILFTVERKSNTIHFGRSRDLRFHKDLMQGVTGETRGDKEFFRAFYSNKNRTHILATMVYAPANSGTYYFEFSDADRIDSAVLQETYTALKRSFFAPVVFHAQTLDHEDVAVQLKSVPFLNSVQLSRKIGLKPEKDLVVHNVGRASGKLIVLRGPADKIDPTVIQNPRQTIVLTEYLPVWLPPVKGIVSVNPSSPLSHLHLLARTWNVPDVTDRGAIGKWGGLDGAQVVLEVSHGQVHVKPIVEKNIEKPGQGAAKASTEVLTLRSELSETKFRELCLLRLPDSVIYGAKAAQLGAVCGLNGVKVPKGIAIPFYWYDRHVIKIDVKKRIAELSTRSQTMTPSQVEEELKQIRELIEATPIDPGMEAQLKQVLTDLNVGLATKQHGVFVRSSTNAEDLKGFSGAGLYTTVPNVRNLESLTKAVKTVWASVWNLNAWLAREESGIHQSEVFGGVLLQIGIEADSAGVMITTDPFKTSSRDSKSSEPPPRSPAAIYINAKRGLGLKVVNGFRIPEQILYTRKTDSFKLLTESDESTQSVFDMHGGVTEANVKSRRALTLAQSGQLMRAAAAIHEHFGRIMDIEWVVAKQNPDQVWIVQARPW
jgi:hypothetical protein